MTKGIQPGKLFSRDLAPNLILIKDDKNRSSNSAIRLLKTRLSLAFGTAHIP